MAERLRSAVEGSRIATPRGDLGVTVSIGGVHVDPFAPYGPQELFNQVDQRLYDAKKAGRNRVAC